MLDLDALARLEKSLSDDAPAAAQAPRLAPFVERPAPASARGCPHLAALRAAEMESAE